MQSASALLTRAVTVKRRANLVAALEALMDGSHEPSEGFPLPTVDGDAAEIMKRKTRP